MGQSQARVHVMHVMHVLPDVTDHECYRLHGPDIVRSLKLPQALEYI